MKPEARREALLDYLGQSMKPTSATALAQRLGVSRQIIVGDVALLRAGGVAILPTPRGYLLQRVREGQSVQVACVHTEKEMVQELYALVDHGCTVVDVAVEHPLYGQLRGELDLHNRFEVDDFVRHGAGIAPLAVLTQGVHLHTLWALDEQSLQRGVQALRNLGFLWEGE